MQGGECVVGEPIRTTVSIYGEDYSLVGDLPEEVVQALAYHVDNRIRVLASKNSRASLNRLAILTALNVAEELFRLQEEHQQLVGTMQQQWRSKREAKDAT